MSATYCYMDPEKIYTENDKINNALKMLTFGESE